MFIKYLKNIIIIHMFLIYLIIYNKMEAPKPILMETKKEPAKIKKEFEIELNNYIL